MKHLVTFAVLFIIIISFPSSTFPTDSTGENFVVYSIKGERLIFYKIIDTMPKDSLLIINFTSVYCQPCKKEIPELKNIMSKGNGRIKLMFIFAETSDAALPIAEYSGIYDQTYIDPFGNIQKLYNVKKYPVTFIINKKYKIIGHFEGYNKTNITMIKKICYVE